MRAGGFVIAAYNTCSRMKATFSVFAMAPNVSCERICNHTGHFGQPYPML